MTPTGTPSFRRLPAARLKKFREQIMAMAKERAEQASEIQEVLRESSDPVFGVHQDWGTDTQNKTVATIQQEIYSRNGVEIEKALARIDAGTYGQCVKCHKNIETARLQAIPITELCCNCSGAKKLH